MNGARRLAALAAAVIAVGAGAEAARALLGQSSSVGANAFATDTLDPPTVLVAVGGFTVTLTWTPTLDAYAAGYRVLRGTSSGGPYAVVATVTPRTAALHVDNPPGVGTFYYVVEAFSGAWTSARSNQAAALAL